MRVFFLIVLIFTTFCVNAKNWSFKYSGYANSNIINLSNGGKIINLSNNGTWEDSLGNYGKGVCYGIAESNKDSDDFFQFYCELNDQDNEKFITKGYRKSEDVETGVGSQKIIDGTGKWIKFIGSICNYGVKYKDEVLFASQKCKSIEKN